MIAKRIVNQFPAQLPQDGFLPEAQLEAWTRASIVRQRGGLLELKGGYQYGFVDAVRVLGRRREERHTTDPYGLCGSVLPLRTLLRQGAILGRDGFRLGSAVYDVEFGCILSAISPGSTG